MIEITDRFTSISAGTDPLEGRVVVFLSGPAPANVRVAYLDVSLFGD